MTGNYKLNFNLQLYQQVWQQLNQSKIITQEIITRQVDLLDTLDITASIPLRIFDNIPSTNTKLWELIDRGIETPIAAIAFQQTAGKGQWGHNWDSSAGGLYLSVALDLDLDLNHNSHLVMAISWGVTTVLRSYRLPITIKWPNDLILNQRKLGGIKIETRNLNNKIVKAVVGAGINWCNPVPEVGINIQSYYYDQGQSQEKIESLEELAAITAYGIRLGYQYYLAVGIEQLLIDYLAILNSLGKHVTVNSCLGEVTGVTTEGRLRVKLRSPGATTEIDLAPGQISLGY
jgi:BirA family transcriptional regulator, biotin operon repressor / biotin---[acetyl-CoA-carboxylase] ligase